MTDRLAALEAALIDSRLRLREHEKQLADLSVAILRIHRRLQPQEAGTALYEVSEDIPRGRH